MFDAGHPLEIAVQAYRDLLPHLQKPDVPAGAFSNAMSNLARHVFLLESAISSQKTKPAHRDWHVPEPSPGNVVSPNVFLEALFSLSPMGTVIINRDGLVLRANQAFLDLFGYQHHEAFLKKLDDLVATSDKIKRLVARINTMATTGKMPLTRTTIRERKDGTRIDVLFTIIPFMAAGKSFAYCIYRNITERTQSRKALRLLKNQLETTLDGTLKAFSKVIEERDPYTAGHQRRVASIATMVAAEIKLSQETTATLYTAALLHDIGKISIPVEILSKPGKLNEEEKNIIDSHSLKGFEIVRTMEFPGPVAECVLQHHERLDGSGYPRGLHGDEILLPAQILAVVDVFEAMISHRPYRPSMGNEAALKELKNGQGVKYNAQAVDALEKLVLSGELDEAIKSSNSAFS